MKSYKEIIDRIVVIGRIQNYEEMEFVNHDGLIWEQKKDFWKNNCVNLKTDDIVALLKSMVFADGRYRNWNTGSAAVLYCYPILSLLNEKLKHIEYDNLLNWIFKNRRNTYIPLGNNIPLSITSLEEYGVARAEESKKREEEYEEAQLRKKVQKEKAVQNKKNNLIAQLKRKEQRELFLTKLKAKSEIDILKTIIADNKHSIDYYPEECSIISDKVIKCISLEEKQILINKLHNSKGSWNLLSEQLKRSIDSTA